MKKVECAINTIWEMKSNVFLLSCISNKTEVNAVNKDGAVNNNFIVDTRVGIVREAKFYFPAEHNDFLIDQYYMGTHCMFRTYAFENGKVLSTPVYYIDNETEEIVA